jgi:hypothetical protein
MEQQALDEARAYEAAPQAHVILIDGPTSKNALNLAAKNRIADLFDALYRYPEVRAIVIIESNGIFAADTDLQEMAGFSPSDHTVWVTDWMFACRSFCDGHRIERECAGCGWAVWVEDGYCRLCWVQLSGGHAWEVTTHKTVAAMTAAGTKISHHQLFFDKMSPRNSARPQAAAAWRGNSGRGGTRPDLGPAGAAEVSSKLLARPASATKSATVGRPLSADL